MPSRRATEEMLLSLPRDTDADLASEEMLLSLPGDTDADLASEEMLLSLQTADNFADAAMWQRLAPLKISPCVMLKALLRWSDADKAGEFLAACPWETSVGDWRSSPWGYGPPLWSAEAPVPVQGELADYLLSAKKLAGAGGITRSDLHGPPLDAAGMKRAGKIIGAAWESADRTAEQAGSSPTSSKASRPRPLQASSTAAASRA
eukprot:scaffold6162_cov59-Phaeocystis_antarctica.AAC.3